jgi:hypothetical protein
MRRLLATIFIAWLAAPALAEWSFVQKNEITTSEARAISISFTAPVTNGHFIMVGTLADRNLTVNTVCDGSAPGPCAAGDTFTSIQTASPSNGLNMTLWCAPITTTGGTRSVVNVTFNGDFGSAALNIAEYADLASCTKNAGSARSNSIGNGSTLTSAAIITTHINDLVLVWVCSANNPINSIGGGSNPTIRLRTSGAFGDSLQSSAGPITMTAQGAVSQSRYGFIIAAFPPAETHQKHARGKPVVF